MVVFQKGFKFAFKIMDFEVFYFSLIFLSFTILSESE